MVKTYENFLDVFRSKMTAKKMTAKKIALFFVKFINSVIENDSITYSWGTVKNETYHNVGSEELEEYVISITECLYNRSRIEFCQLDDMGNSKLRNIKNDLENIQEFIKNTMNPIFDEDDTGGVTFHPMHVMINNKIQKIKYMINLEDFEKIRKDINKEEYEVFKSSKKYNL